MEGVRPAENSVTRASNTHQTNHVPFEQFREDYYQPGASQHHRLVAVTSSPPFGVCRLVEYQGRRKLHMTCSDGPVGLKVELAGAMSTPCHTCAHSLTSNGQSSAL